MKLTLPRRWKEGDATIGVLSTEDGWTCFTLEDEVRGILADFPACKIPGKTAIPAGTYAIEVTMSERFKRMLPILKDVPCFSGVRFHAGNVPADTDGCILVGEGHEFGRVTESRAALNTLLVKIGQALALKESVSIEISDEFQGGQP